MRSVWADRLMALSVRFVGLLILVATLAAAAASFLYNQAQEDDRASRVAMQVDMRLRDQIAVLEGVGALYQSDMVSSGPGIRSYLAALRPQVRVPGMQGVGIAIAMRKDTPAAVEARLRENYGSDVKVWPATDQPIGFPIVLIEPDNARNHGALGYDMYSDPVRREAMRRAWQTGQPASTAIVELVQEREVAAKQPGFLVYVPVYAGSRPLPAAPPAAESLPGDPPTVPDAELSVLEPNPAPVDAPPTVATAAGARPIEGFVYAPFRVHDLMTSVLGSQLATIDGIEVRAGKGPAARIVFRHGTMGWDAHEKTLRVADRQWTMRISYGRFIDRIGRPIGIFLFGTALALLATQLHRLQQRRLGVAQTLADEKARHAEDRELMIGEMAHRMKNAFARIGALARITARESRDLEDFEAKFDGRMRALSDAKQMLVTGAVDNVELGRIVRRELELAGRSPEQLDAVNGPDVRLDDEGAQALALAIHEFVTNSIKYGALGGEGEVAIAWRRDGGDVELNWVESGLAETPKIEGESFGTQFIRTLIERQLKGSWNRSAADHSLVITIRWPDRDPAS